MERLFSKAQRRKLFIRADGRCERCEKILRDGWEAHHVKRWADGGETYLHNAMALCKACHKQMHRSKAMTLKPRGWQNDAMKVFRDNLASDKKQTLISCTPGGGKTIFSALAFLKTRELGMNLKVIVVVPTTALKSSFKNDYHIAGAEVTPVIKEDRVMPPSQYDGCIVTYAQLGNMVATFEQWWRNGERMMFVFDEVHHASENNSWGAAAETCERFSDVVLSMTGTPFRGDGRKISFVEYGDDGVAVPDYGYGYRQAVTDSVCRSLFFEHDDAIATWRENGVNRSVQASECSAEDMGRAQAAVFSSESDWMANVLTKASNKLDEYRVKDPDAGGLVICRPGSDENETRNLHKVAKTIERITGDKPTVISYEDRDADEKIERFRKGIDRWVVSVRKISEGVDIKRLRVLVVASAPSTELLFRQIVGRVVRVENPMDNEDSTVYIAKFPKLRDWAERIAEEAQAGLREKSEVTKTDPDNASEMPQFDLLNVEHLDGGGVAHHGGTYSNHQIRLAEEYKRKNPALSMAPVDVILETLRVSGALPDLESTITPEEDSHLPLHDRKLRRWNQVERKRRHLTSRIYGNQDGRPTGKDYQEVASWMFRRIGVKNKNDLLDNHGIEKIDQALSLLNKRLNEFDQEAV